MQQLFKLHDLDGDGMLSEDELIKLNEKVAMLHYGKTTDRTVVQERYRALFRARLDPDGRPVPFAQFQSYMRGVLNELDADPNAQEMILEQFIAEAKSGRAVFHCDSFASVTDERYLSKISHDPHLFGSTLSSSSSFARPV